MNTNRPELFCPDAFLTYPHQNGFFGAGNRVVVCRAEERRWTLFAVDLQTGIRIPLCHIDRAGDTDIGGNQTPMWDVAFEAERLVFKQQNALWLLDIRDALTRTPGTPTRIYTPPAGATVNLLASISHDGRTVVFKQESDVEGPFHEGNHSGNRLDVATGEVHTFLRTRWWSDHFQPCPHNEEWIGYGRQTWGTPAYNEPGEIMWAWHPEHAPEGRCLFDQFAASRVPGKPLFTTHDRWAFHETCLLTVVYPGSPGGPRGLWQVWPDGRRPPRLVSEGDRDWHCDISRDGHFAVVDTNPVYDWPGCPWDGEPGNSDIILIDMQTGERRFLARTAWGGGQHPHPVFTPDGRAVLYHRSAVDTDGRGRADIMVVAL
jgi:hypothetical protein